MAGSGAVSVSAAVSCHCPGQPSVRSCTGFGRCGFKKDWRHPPTILAWECGRFSHRLASGGETAPVREDVEQIKQRIPLLEYLQRRNWTGCRISGREEFVGLCPLHADTRPSFYVNARKNLFYCHGCQRGGDLIRFVELSRHLSFRESIACLEQAVFQPVGHYSRRIGAEVAPHDLRRTFAKLAHKGHAALEQIQITLGHASIQTTERYLGIEQDLTDAPCDHLGLRV